MRATTPRAGAMYRMGVMDVGGNAKARRARSPSPGRARVLVARRQPCCGRARARRPVKISADRASASPPGGESTKVREYGSTGLTAMTGCGARPPASLDLTRRRGELTACDELSATPRRMDFSSVLSYYSYFRTSAGSGAGALVAVARTCVAFAFGREIGRARDVAGARQHAVAAAVGEVDQQPQRHPDDQAQPGVARQAGHHVAADQDPQDGNDRHQRRLEGALAVGLGVAQVDDAAAH